MLPQSGSMGVNFFAQNLSPEERYFCCPPTKLIIPCYRAIAACPGAKALLLMPEWYGANNWPYFFNGKEIKQYIVSVTPFQAGFFFANSATSKVFSAKPKFRMLALLINVAS